VLLGSNLQTISVFNQEHLIQKFAKGMDELDEIYSFSKIQHWKTSQLRLIQLNFFPWSQNSFGDVSKCSLSNTQPIPTHILKSVLGGTGLYCPYNISGNLSTNPFVVNSTSVDFPACGGLLTPESPQPVLPPKISMNPSPPPPPPYLHPKTSISQTSPAAFGAARY
jgi:hypothetical protein